MTPTDNLVGQQVENRSGRARIVTQHVATDMEQAYLQGAAALAANGIRDMAPVRKMLKKVVKEPRQRGEKVEG